LPIINFGLSVYILQMARSTVLNKYSSIKLLNIYPCVKTGLQITPISRNARKE